MYTKGSKRPLRTDAKYSQDETNAEEFALGTEQFNADDKAWLEAQVEVTPEEKQPESAGLRLPKVSHIKGQVTSITGAIPSKTKKDSFFRVVTVEDWITGAVYQRPVSESFYQGSSSGSGLKDILKVDNFVDVTINHLIEGVTEYVDSNTGDVLKHSGTSEVIQGATAISAERYRAIFQASLKA